MIDYYKNVIDFILNSKLPSSRKLELMYNLDSFFESKRKRRIRYYIDEQGFELFKQIIIKEEKKYGYTIESSTRGSRTNK